MVKGKEKLAFVRGGGSMMLAVAGLLLSGCARDVDQASATRAEFTSYLRGATEGTPGRGPANGAFDATYDPATHVLDWHVKWSRLKGSTTSVEFLHPMAAVPTAGALNGSVILGPRGGRDLADGKVHINVMTSSFPNGEVRGRLHPDANQPTPGQVAMTAILLGSKEPRPTSSTGVGTVTATYHPADRRLDWELSALSLKGAPIGAAFESRLSMTPIGSNGMRGRMELSDKEAADLHAGLWAVNIPTDAYPLGEIRGQLVPQK